MDGNNAKSIPTLDGLVDTATNHIGGTNSQAQPTVQQDKPKLTPVNQANPIDSNHQPHPAEHQTSIHVNKRRTDKSEFEVKLTKIVQQILAAHIEASSEKIVQEVLREVRSRLPGQRKA